jgi:hypothetical protein
VSHLQETHVQRLEREICSSFTGNSFELDITSGQSHLTIRLQATEFVPSQYESLRFPIISSGTIAELSMFMHEWTLPIALYRVGKDDLSERCRLYITTMIRQPGYLSELFPPTINIVSKQILYAAIRYHKSICHSPQVFRIQILEK